jgi:trehalose 6-phosphate synthase/phosphatase
MSRLIIVSNRLPVTINKQEGELIYHPSAGGLATGLNSLDDSTNKLWVGWPGREVRDLWEQEAIRKDLESQHLYPVFLSKQEIKLYYEGFSNKTIWPHFHYFTQHTTYNETYWEAYQKANQHFADEVLKIVKEGDLVWVHDYQLMLLPALIREKHPSISIGFFLHIPFPSYELFRMLPYREALLKGVLGADQLGFHTYDYMRHFLSAVYRIGGYEHQFGRITVDNRPVNVDVFPMGIDYDKYAYPEVDFFKEDDSLKIKALAKKQKLIISIDRLDYTKGIPQRIYAFEHFLRAYPTYRGKVTLLMLVVPSRSNVDQYKDLKEQIETLVGRINGQFGTFDWTPIQYFYRSLNFSQLTTLYQVAQIAMITPLRDGMNLVAKEYIASKEVSKEGVLILSEMAGASSELTEAITVNPQDTENMAESIRIALEMNKNEQAWRLQIMQEKLKKYDVKHWANTFLKVQTQLMEEQKDKSILRLKKGVKSDLIQAYKKAKKRLIILDYDGTLMDFHPNPKAVIPDESLIRTLRKLAQHESNKLVVNSGRDRPTLEEWLGPLGIDLAAEHGVWVKHQGQWQRNPNLVSDWKKSIIEVLETMVERTPGSFIEEKDFSVAWHYRQVDRDFGEKRVREFRDVLLYLTANLDLQVLEGNKVVEVKNAGVNKGKASMQWLNAADWDFIMAIGDDHTDEDTFKVLPKTGYSIKVGLGASAARFNVLSVTEVRNLLKELIKE